MPEHRTAVVTGATGGIGRFVALGLAQAGMEVVLVGRDPGRGAAATAWIRDQVQDARLHFMLADLSSLGETCALGTAIAGAHPRLSVLVNNAGVFLPRRTTTAEGHETVLAVNHLSPFVLTRLLEPALRAGAPARLVTVGSSTADTALIDPANLELRHGWGLKHAYAQSKLAATMTTFKWARRWSGTGVVANVVHPGTVATGLVRARGVIGLAWRVMALFSRTEQQGADTPVFVATAPELETVTGTYFKDRRPARPNHRALDEVLVQRVWTATEDLVTQGPA